MSVRDPQTGPDDQMCPDHPRAEPASMTAALVGLGGSIGDDDQLTALLDRVVDVAREMIRGVDAAAIAVELGGRTHTATHTHETVHSPVLVAPLVAFGQPLGALTLYAREPAGLVAVDTDAVALLTTTVGRAIGDFARFRSALDVADALRAALHNRAPIEQAKGIIMAEHGIGADEAFGLLRARSQNSNRRVRDIAAELIAQRTGGRTPT
ncbi:ANTAR domain-containing response regulator [Williamsia deligens]|uniref:ANTAR domain-containing response regulator n=1 Tax=Williamsia deligens TaxID=321325 RepID=A0ABW3G2D0_9NOCA|nr:ANTAR domain-containing protein [Williamsia deligens]MCP2194637.1 ANTAR domain-containing protein [Williamsia deligens]